VLVAAVCCALLLFIVRGEEVGFFFNSYLQ